MFILYLGRNLIQKTNVYNNIQVAENVFAVSYNAIPVGHGKWNRENISPSCAGIISIILVMKWEMNVSHYVLSGCQGGC